MQRQGEVKEWGMLGEQGWLVQGFKHKYLEESEVRQKGVVGTGVGWRACTLPPGQALFYSNKDSGSVQIGFPIFPKEDGKWGFPGGSEVKSPPANARDTGLSPGLGRSHVLRSN